MFKAVFILYVVCYACYIFYTREPDYFDGEVATATISFNKNNNVIAAYKVDNKNYTINANYVFRKLQLNEEVKIIYNPAHPEKAAVYSFWGYWFTWGELLLSSVLMFALYQLAVSITKNPNEDEIEDDDEVKSRKYV